MVKLKSKSELLRGNLVFRLENNSRPPTPLRRMKMKLVETAENRAKIMASQEIYCQKCNAKQFSPFDKLFVSAYGFCVDCDTPESVEEKSKNIFNIIEA
jgi:hypothetical protein